MNFIFKFERLLKIRIFKKEELENQLAVLQNELFREREELKRLYLTLEEQYKLQTQSLCGKLNINDVITVRNYIIKLCSDIEIQKKVIIQLSDETNVKKNQLIKAVQKVKILEKLKEKKYRQFLKEREIAETYVLDEIGLNQFLRK
ncbi:MAG TPA: flagellar export protein FliJ [bacterium]|nr:flagellar export protein FliJ [bacterium]HPN29926.1 flagellar export protein FliJ [bacterium]